MVWSQSAPPLPLCREVVGSSLHMRIGAEVVGRHFVRELSSKEVRAGSVCALLGSSLGNSPFFIPTLEQVCVPGAEA